MNIVKLEKTEVGFTAKIIHKLKWWQRFINFFHPFYKEFTPLDNLQSNDIVIKDHNGEEVIPVSVERNVPGGVYKVDCQLTKGSVFISSNIHTEYMSVTEDM